MMGKGRSDGRLRQEGEWMSWRLSFGHRSRPLTMKRARVAFDKEFRPQRTILAQRAPALANGSGTCKPVNERHLYQDLRQQGVIQHIEAPRADTLRAFFHWSVRERLGSVGLRRASDCKGVKLAWAESMHRIGHLGEHGYYVTGGRRSPIRNLRSQQAFWKTRKSPPHQNRSGDKARQL